MINSSSFFGYRIFSAIKTDEGKLAESLIYLRQALKFNNSVNYKANYAFQLHDLGLHDLAEKELADTEFPVLHYWQRNNTEHYLTAIRSRFPRSENDSLGRFIRAEAELLTKYS